MVIILNLLVNEKTKWHSSKCTLYVKMEFLINVVTMQWSSSSCNWQIFKDSDIGLLIDLQFVTFFSSTFISKKVDRLSPYLPSLWSTKQQQQYNNNKKDKFGNNFHTKHVFFFSLRYFVLTLYIHQL